MQESFFNNIIRSVSWTLLHSLWQGLVVAIIAGIVIIATRRSSATFRYSLLFMIFLSFLAGTCITFLIEWNTGSASLAQSTSLLKAGNPGTGSPTLLQSIFIGFTNFFNANASWLVLTWSILLAFKLTGMIIGLRQVHQLRFRHIHPPGEHWQRRLLVLSNKMGLRKKVSLAESALVSIPIILGHFKPMILVPIGALTNLAPGEVEAVLLHELAHVRRQDYLVNLLQRFCEAIFFFNPGLRWISQQMRIEREHCCDDLAISHTRNRLQFAEALLSFKEHSLKQPAYAIGLFGNQKMLVQRMTRLVYNKQKSLSLFESLFLLLSVVVLLALTAGISKPQERGLANHLSAAAATDSILLITPDVIDKTKSVIHFSQSAQPVQSTVETTSINVKETNKETQAMQENNEVEYIADLSTYKTAAEYPSQVPKNLSIPSDVDLARMQADKDRKQAEVDRKQADKDRAQAEIDRQAADKDRVQADKDREEAERNRKLADIDRARADLDRQKADEDRRRIELENKSQSTIK